MIERKKASSSFSSSSSSNKKKSLKLEMRKQLMPLVLVFFFAPFMLFILLTSKMNPLSALNDLQTFTRTNIEIHVIEENTAAHQPKNDHISLPLSTVPTNNEQLSSKNDKEEIQIENVTFSDNEAPKLSIEEKHNPGKQETEDSSRAMETAIPTREKEEPQIAEDSKAIETSIPRDKEELHRFIDPAETKAADGRMSCDFSQPRSDICTLRGDTRILGASASIILVKSSQANHPTPHEPPLKIKPFTRKWEHTTMERITEFSLRASSNPAEIPKCTVTHTVPAVVFSLGVFLNNFFHHFTDVLIPLFLTSFHYDREVRFFVTNYDEEWMKKYEVIMKRLTRYQIVNLDRDSNTHCVEHLQLGMISHSDLGVDPSRSPNNLTITDFRAFLRSCLGLKREAVRVSRRRRPRLLLVYRTGSRALVNRNEVVRMARSVGFKVVQAGPAATGDLVGFARVVNSCDMMMGVHGAGLTNMLFLPEEAALLQIVPWGALKATCDGDFGWPARGMGLKYYDYEIREEESTLIERYPRNDPVFTDPVSIHRQGWNMLWLVFLVQQNVRLDVQRFRGTLEDAFRTFPRPRQS